MSALTTLPLIFGGLTSLLGLGRSFGSERRYRQQTEPGTGPFDITPENAEAFDPVLTVAGAYLPAWMREPGRQLLESAGQEGGAANVIQSVLDYGAQQEQAADVRRSGERVDRVLGPAQEAANARIGQEGMSQAEVNQIVARERERINAQQAQRASLAEQTGAARGVSTQALSLERGRAADEAIRQQAASELDAQLARLQFNRAFEEAAINQAANVGNVYLANRTPLDLLATELGNRPFNLLGAVTPSQVRRDARVSQELANSTALANTLLGTGTGLLNLGYTNLANQRIADAQGGGGLFGGGGGGTAIGALAGAAAAPFTGGASLVPGLLAGSAYDAFAGGNPVGGVLPLALLMASGGLGGAWQGAGLGGARISLPTGPIPF